MKNTVCLVLLCISTFASRAEENISQRLQKGLFEEEANHNLPAAIEQYKTVIGAIDQERKLAAVALYRLGESYRKLGREEEANQAYNRVVRDFSDQKEAVAKASERLGGSQAVAYLSSRIAAGADKSGSVFSQIPTRHGSVASNTSKVELAALAELLNNSPDLLDAPFTNSMTLLQHAVANRNLDTMRFLLKRGADLSRETSKVGPPLYIAVEGGNKSAAELLIDAGADVNIHWGKDGATPLHAAARKGYTVLSELLLDKGADVNARDSLGATPLYTASRSGHAEEVSLLIKRGADLEANIIPGGTPLIGAIFAKSQETVDALLKGGANPNSRGRNTQPPLTLAAILMGSSATQSLLDAGADVNEQDEKGQTALIAAITAFPSANSEPTRASQLEVVVKTLLDHKANPDLADNYGLTALQYAFRNPAVPDSLVKALLEHGADANVRDDELRTPLHIAVRAQDLSYHYSGGPRPVRNENAGIDLGKLELLLKAKADPNLPDSFGRTPLFYAVFYAVKAASSGQKRIAVVATKDLLEAGADPNWKAKDGTTPLSWSQEAETSELLIEHGAKKPAEKNDAESGTANRSVPRTASEAAKPAVPAGAK